MTSKPRDLVTQRDQYNPRRPMFCPKCGFDQPDAALECARCGVVFAKLQRESPKRPASDAVAAWDAVAPPSVEEPQWFSEPADRAAAKNVPPPPGPTLTGTREGSYTPPPATLPDVFDEAKFAAVRGVRSSESDEVRDGRIGRSELMILGTGLVIAIVVYAVPFTRMVFSLIVTLFHEFGHAVMGWLFGMPSIPAFDFVYGGGWTHYGNFHPSIAIVIAGFLGYGIWLFRENRKTSILIGALLLVWLVMVTAEWRRELVVASAGHAAEFVLAGIFFYMALSGVGWRMPEVERPLGAFVAFFVQIHSMAFAWRLMHDPDFLAWYREGKGGAAMNDLEIVSLDLNIYARMHTSIENVAAMLLVFSFVPIAVALIWYFQRARWHRVMRLMRTADA